MPPSLSVVFGSVWSTIKRTCRILRLTVVGIAIAVMLTVDIITHYARKIDRP